MRLADFQARRAFSLTVLAAACRPAWIQPAHADLAEAAANGFPLVGRFEKLKGANAFIGAWDFAATTGPDGLLYLRKNGDVELTSSEGGNILGLGTQPWSYVSAKGRETIVSLRFDCDVSTADYGILNYEATVDSEGGPEREMEGLIFSDRGRQVGGFKARPHQQHDQQ
jgi:hypothetical protein